MLRLLAVADERTLLALRRLYPGAHFERHCSSVSLDRCLRSTPINGVVIIGDCPDFDEQCVIRIAAFNRMPLIFYGALDFLSASVLDVVRGAANPRIFLKSYDPGGGAVQFLQSQSPAREQLAFRSALEEPLARLPLRVSEALTHQMSVRATGGTVELAAERAGLSTHRLLELLKKAGFKGAHCLLRARKMIDAWGFGLDDAYGAEELAEISGFKTAAGLRGGLAFLGVTSRAELCAMSGDEVVDAGLRRVLQR